jgi:outer membrane immunogenic protein
MKRLIVTSLAAVGVSVGLSVAASAADLTPVYSKAPAAPFTWTGVYLGGNAGYGFQADDGDVALASPSVTGIDMKQTGGFVGIQMGYNYQIGMWVLGLEGDVQAANLRKSETLTAAGDSIQASSNVGDWGTIRGRVGVAFDHLLVYGTGGAALGSPSNSLQVNLPSGAQSSFLQNDATQFGYVVGAGLEYAVDRRWTMKLEYQYVNLGSYSLSAPEFNAGGTQIGTTTSSSITNDFHTVRIGANWRFYQ